MCVLPNIYIYMFVYIYIQQTDWTVFIFILEMQLVNPGVIHKAKCIVVIRAHDHLSAEFGCSLLISHHRQNLSRRQCCALVLTGYFVHACANMMQTLLLRCCINTHRLSVCGNSFCAWLLTCLLSVKCKHDLFGQTN